MAPPPWLFGTITKDQASTLLMHDGAYPTGRFLVRRRPGSEDDYVLSLNFKNRPTHHLIKKTESGVLTVNKQDFGGFTTLEQIISKLSSDSLPPKWPVKLTDAVENKANNPEQTPADPEPAHPSADAAAPAPEQDTPVIASQPAAPATTTGSASDDAHPWMHPPMTKGEADALVKKHGMKEGTFLVRPRGAAHPNEYVLTVVYKGKSTHHLLKQADKQSTFTVNGNVMPDCMRIEQVIAGLRSTKKFWPVPLQDHVPPSSDTGGAGAERDAELRAAEDGRRREREQQRMREEEERKKREAEEAERRRREQQQEEEQARKKREEEEAARRRAEEEEERKKKEEEERRKRQEEEEERARREREEQEREEEERRRRQKIEEEERAAQEEMHGRTKSELQERARAQARAQSRRGDNPLAAASHGHNESRASESESRLEPDRGRRWENGDQFDVHVCRTNPTVPFGFGIATMWRIDGRVKCVSWVDPEGPASGALEVEDIIVAMDGEVNKRQAAHDRIQLVMGPRARPYEGHSAV
ncbi:hypothetical protein PTSG_06550 [Salpingoeca rosetta]|uniref:SH2 domain-containing protein n=1 Tax=Salpingoeca rosetta (strain ATCC 50818 / BSB-021) TaxID=946362 RepID=F2UG48_SALR5|nr:uncharacterized protein PTSG_06550 [Salpingoeca rosetta]EGD75476.1 hypothetical protein PTSG_06550 [Salpingoeca rosetta]|eukprot:XP_004991933.1 hypothetical protein PTSG_06550 [Salpingoeca rosetta]